MLASFVAATTAIEPVISNGETKTRKDAPPDLGDRAAPASDNLALQDSPLSTDFTDQKAADRFFWTYTEEPHRTRRQAIIKAHPGVRPAGSLLPASKSSLRLASRI